MESQLHSNLNSDWRPVHQHPPIEVRLPIEPLPPLPVIPPLHTPSPKQLEFLRPLRCTLQEIALAAVSTLLDADRLRALEQYLDQLPGTTAAERGHLREFVQRFGQRERKRPRDRLLRDGRMKRVAMEVRRRTAFLGYEWQRIRGEGMQGELGLEAENCEVDGCENDVSGCAHALPPHRGGFQGWEDNVAAVRALHRGPWSLR